MVEEIGNMVPEVSSEYDGLSSFVAPFGESSRGYVPLRKRQTCESLEEKREKAQIKKKACPSERPDAVENSGVFDGSSGVSSKSNELESR